MNLPTLVMLITYPIKYTTSLSMPCTDIDFDSIDPCTATAVLQNSHGFCNEMLESLSKARKEPTIEWNDAKADSKYILMMLDPDAPDPNFPDYKYWIHWIVTDLPGSDLIKGSVTGNIVMPYEEPTPPFGVHRYQFFLFEHPSSFMGELLFFKDRGSFDLPLAVKEHTLCLKAAYQYRAKDESVPAGFTYKPPTKRKTISESMDENATVTESVNKEIKTYHSGSMHKEATSSGSMHKEATSSGSMDTNSTVHGYCTEIDFNTIEPCSATAVLHNSHGHCNQVLTSETNTVNEPIISWSDANDDSTYILMMVDPDAPDPAYPYFKYWIHWIMTDVSGSDLVIGGLVGNRIMTYEGPDPPSGVHRYQFFLFEQPPNFKGEVLHFGDRASFDLAAVVDSFGLCLKAAYQYLAYNGPSPPVVTSESETKRKTISESMDEVPSTSESMDEVPSTSESMDEVPSTSESMDEAPSTSESMDEVPSTSELMDTEATTSKSTNTKVISTLKTRSEQKIKAYITTAVTAMSREGVRVSGVESSYITRSFNVVFLLNLALFMF